MYRLFLPPTPCHPQLTAPLRWLQQWLLARDDEPTIARALLQSPGISFATRDALERYLDLAFPPPARMRAGSSPSKQRIAGGGGKLADWLHSGTGRQLPVYKPLAHHVLPSLAREALMHGLRVGNSSTANADGSFDVRLYCAAVSGAEFGAFVQGVTFTMPVSPTTAEGKPSTKAVELKMSSE